MLVSYPIVIQINKDVRIAFQKLLNAIILGCSVEEFPNCVDHFVKQYEVDYVDIFPDEEDLKIFVVETIKGDRNFLSDLRPFFTGYLEKIPKGNFCSYYLNTFSEKADNVKKWPLYTFNENYLEDFRTKENLALIHYGFFDLKDIYFEYWPFQCFYDQCGDYYSNYFFYVFAGYFGIK